MSVSSIYLYIGFQSACTAHADDLSKVIVDEGHIGVAQLCANKSKLIDAMLQMNPSVAFPGVFHYDVTEVMGQWLYHHISQDDEAFIQKLEAVCYNYLEKTS